MCTYLTFAEKVSGSVKGPAGAWLRVSDLTVYFDHPVHAMAEHTVNVDLADPASGPSGRLAIELEPRSARALAEAILKALDAAGDLAPS